MNTIKLIPFATTKNYIIDLTPFEGLTLPMLTIIEMNVMRIKQWNIVH